MAAEIKIYCIQSQKSYVADHLKSSIANSDSLLFSDYLHTEERCK